MKTLHLNDLIVITAALRSKAEENKKMAVLLEGNPDAQLYWIKQWMQADELRNAFSELQDKITDATVVKRIEVTL